MAKGIAYMNPSSIANGTMVIIPLHAPVTADKAFNELQFHFSFSLENVLTY